MNKLNYFNDYLIKNNKINLKSKYVKETSVSCNHEIKCMDSVNIKDLPGSSVDLVVTSPPYWNIKDYGSDDQLGFRDDLDSYFQGLLGILGSCINCLVPNGKMCINIGDQFISAKGSSDKAYKIIPLSSILVSRLLESFPDDIIYLSTINWVKVSNSKTSGGGHIMGSYPYPNNGYFFTNREYILIFRKVGKNKIKKDIELKEASALSLDDWNTYFRDTWKITPEKQIDHPAVYPDDLPLRLIRMYSFVGDLVLDPFMGSGSTSLAASKSGRNSLGYEIGFMSKSGLDWKQVVRNRVNAEYHELSYPVYINKKFKGIGKLKIENKLNFSELC